MATLVGTQDDFSKVLKELVELDYDAVEAYEAAINRIENTTYQNRLIEFKSDHQRHIKEVSELLRRHGEEPPTGPSAGKQWLTKGKVILGNLLGDNAILQAMSSNEEDTNTAYERVNSHPKKWEDADDIIRRGLADEKRHKAWIDSVLT